MREIPVSDSRKSKIEIELPITFPSNTGCNAALRFSESTHLRLFLFLVAGGAGVPRNVFFVFS